MPAKILSCATAAPPHCYPMAEVFPYIERWLESDDDLRRRALKVLESAAIRQRSSIIPIEEIFTERSFEEKNNAYMEHAVDMACKVFEKALVQSKLEATDIDCLISVSCTGYMIPSMDAYLINRCGLRRDTQRLPVMQMGCAGGTSGIIYATDYLRAHPGRHVALVSVEFPTLTFQLGDRSMTNIVSSAIFAAGAACVILGDSPEVRPTVLANSMYNFPDGPSLMGYALRNDGLQIVLDRAVPDAINEHFGNILDPFLAAQRVDLADIEHMIFHPGSVKILRKAEELLGRHGKNLDDSHAVLAEHGNMSSATVLFILERVLRKHPARADRALMLSFGPGFVGQTVLLQWS
ncbi:MAG: type III polyketide synthase [Planctomycetota bacterium]